MEPIYPEYEMDYDEEDHRELYIQAATRLTCSAIEAEYFKKSDSVEESAEGIMLFFEVAYRRIRQVAEEEDDDYLEEVEENGDHELH
jgi:hypothetical protein